MEKAIENEASGDNEQCEDVEGEIDEQPTTSKKSKKRKAKKRKKAKQAESVSRPLFAFYVYRN